MAYSYIVNETKTYTTTPIYSSSQKFTDGTSLVSDSNWGILGWYNCSVASSFTFKNTKTTTGSSSPYVTLFGNSAIVMLFIFE